MLSLLWNRRGVQALLRPVYFWASPPTLYGGPVRLGVSGHILAAYRFRFGDQGIPFSAPRERRHSLLHRRAPAVPLRKQGAMGLVVRRLGRCGFIPNKYLRYKRLPRTAPPTLTQGRNDHVWLTSPIKRFRFPASRPHAGKKIQQSTARPGSPAQDETGSIRLSPAGCAAIRIPLRRPVLCFAAGCITRFGAGHSPLLGSFRVLSFRTFVFSYLRIFVFSISATADVMIPSDFPIF